MALPKLQSPAGLAGLLEPNAPEGNAFLQNRHMLGTAFMLQRLQGLQDMQNTMSENNQQEFKLAQQEMQQARLKELGHLATSEPGLMRLPDSSAAMAAAYPELASQFQGQAGADMSAVNRKVLPAHITQLTKPNASGNTITTTGTTDSRITYVDPNTNTEVAPNTPGAVPMVRQSRTSTRGPAQPPAGARIPTAPPQSAAPPAGGQPSIVRQEKLPDGRTRGYDAQGKTYILQ